MPVRLLPSVKRREGKLVRHGTGDGWWPAMHILVASSSAFRQTMYRDAVESLGHEVSLTSGGVECTTRIREKRPDMLILEAPLFWGGAEGVLQVVETETSSRHLPVILVAVGTGTIDWFRLSHFRIDNFLFRVPTVQEIGEAVARIMRLEPSRNPWPPDQAEASLG